MIASFVSKITRRLLPKASCPGKALPALGAMLLAGSGSVSGQTYFPLSSGNYTQSFSDVATWTTPGTGSFSGLAIMGGTDTPVPNPLRITAASTTAFSTGSSGGIQKGTENLVFLSTGSTDNSSSTGIDLNLDATGRTIGTLQFNAATVFNTSGNRNGTLRVYTSTDGTNWTEIVGGGLPFVATNFVAASAAINAALPVGLSNSATVKLRFYYQNGVGGIGTPLTGSRPKISIDDLVVTSTATGTDATPPAIATLSPTNGATLVPVNTTLAVTFNEPIVAGAGSVSLYTSNGMLVQSLPASAAVITGSVTATFTLTDPLTVSTGYYVRIDATAFEDAAGNDFAGISNNTTWAFTTVGPDIVGPVPQIYAPLNGSTTVRARTPLTYSVTFGEDIDIAAGATATLRLASQTTGGETISFNENEIIYGNLNQAAVLLFETQLEYSQSYKITIPAGAFLDSIGNPSAAIEWSFTAVPEPPSVPLVSATPYTQDFATFGPESETSSAPLLPPGWSLQGTITTFIGDVAQRSFGAGSGNGLRGIVGENVLGYQATGSTEDSTLGIFTFEKILTLRNQTGAVLTNIVVSYDGKVARADQGRSPEYTVRIGNQTVGALQYSTASGNSQLIASIGGLNVPPNDVFQIIWSTGRGSGAGASKQIGLSNVAVRVGTAALPPAVVGPFLKYDLLSHRTAGFTVNVTSDNTSTVTQRGIVYSVASVNPTPALAGTGVTAVMDAAPGTGEFTSSMSGLTPSTTYAVRGFATNANGVKYTSVFTLTTLPALPLFAGNYSQPFDNFISGTAADSLTSGWPAGWTLVSSGGVQAFNAPATPTSTPWASGGLDGGFYGNLSDPGLLGYLHTGSSGVLTNKVTLVNNTGGALTQLYVGYLGRVGNLTAGRYPAWEVSLNGTPIPALAYSTADGLDKNVSGIITGLNIAPGAEFAISWASTRGDVVGSNGNSRKIGLAEVVIALEQPPVVPTGFASWAATNAGGQGVNQDFDNDGVKNGLEYFFGATGSTFTPNPAIVAGKIKWPTAGVTDLTYRVQTSDNLTVWNTVPTASLDLTEAGFIGYTLPASTPGAPKLFVRFVVAEIP